MPDFSKMNGPPGNPRNLKDGLAHDHGYNVTNEDWKVEAYHLNDSIEVWMADYEDPTLLREDMPSIDVSQLLLKQAFNILHQVHETIQRTND